MSYPLHPQPTPPAFPEIIPASDEDAGHPIPPLTQQTPPNPKLPSTSASPDLIPAACPKAVLLIVILETSDKEEDPISREKDEEPVPKRSRLSCNGKYHNQYNWPPVPYGQSMQETIGLCEDPNTCELIVISILLNLIGKTLNSSKKTPWMERRTNSYGAALGFDRDSTELIRYQPSLEFCRKYNAEVRARLQLRRRCFIEAWILSMKSGPIGTAASTVLVLLRGAELTNFASIVQQLLVLHPELMGWNALAKFSPNIIKAYRKFSVMGKYGDRIKLLLPDAMVEEFQTSNLSWCVGES
ncbi:unnamed protein product [Bemisia tabaci]|uniref:Uncharacterized protein n=1 Tax=Bemisia tabaci TaxID=7038 RepID=A0A9P0A7Z2_BEMTA|nr:unnamed protein product [Bemisia tabaci]